MKRRTVQPHKRRDRKLGVAPYTKYGKRPYKYPFPVGAEALAPGALRNYRPPIH